jgi:hypothetical protein
VPAGGIKSGASDGVSVVSGTKGSNPLCSREESSANFLEPTFARNWKFESSPLQQRDLGREPVPDVLMVAM